MDNNISIKSLRSDILIAAVPALIFFALVLILDLGTLRAFNITLFAQYIIVAPVLEEVIFCSTIQRVAYDKFPYRLGPITLANILTSFVFASAHAFTTSSLHSASIFIPSLIFGLLYDRNRSVVPCMVVHAIYNINVFILYKPGFLSNFF